jgi:hypothetical protein
MGFHYENCECATNYEILSPGTHFPQILTRKMCSRKATYSHYTEIQLELEQTYRVRTEAGIVTEPYPQSICQALLRRSQ